MASHPFLRPLLPATLARTDIQEPGEPGRLKRKRRSVACKSCQLKRTKCSGSSPCDECARTKSDCHYDPSKDKRRKEPLQRAQRTEEVLKIIINILYQGTDSDVKKLKARVKLSPSPEESMKELLNDVFI